MFFFFLQGACAQEIDSLKLGNKLDYKFFIFEPTINLDYDFTSQEIDLTTFNIYNRITGLNDIYLGFDENYSTYSKSIFVEENQYRGFKKDSFNPMGLSTDKSSLAAGLLNFAINKFK